MELLLEGWLVSKDDETDPPDVPLREASECDLG